MMLAGDSPDPVLAPDAGRPAGDSDDWSFVESVRVFAKSSKQGSVVFTVHPL